MNTPSHTHHLPSHSSTLARVQMVCLCPLYGPSYPGSQECLWVEGCHASTLPRSLFHFEGSECPEMGRVVRDARRSPEVCLWAPAVSQAGKVCWVGKQTWVWAPENSLTQEF